MKQSPLLRISARNGAIAGILSVVLAIVLYYLGRHPILIAPYLDFRIFLFGTFIFFTLKEFRDYHQGGELYFWQGIIGAGIVVFIASAIASIGIHIFGSINKGFVDQYVQQTIAYLKTFPKEEIQRIGKELYERNLESLPTTDIANLSLKYFFQGMFIGFFVSIILSVILRKQPKTT